MRFLRQCCRRIGSGGISIVHHFGHDAGRQTAAHRLIDGDNGIRIASEDAADETAALSSVPRILHRAHVHHHGAPEQQLREDDRCDRDDLIHVNEMDTLPFQPSTQQHSKGEGEIERLAQKQQPALSSIVIEAGIIKLGDAERLDCLDAAIRENPRDASALRDQVRRHAPGRKSFDQLEQAA